MIFGTKDLADVRLNGITFNTTDANGITWIIDDIDGWWYPPSVAMPDITRPDVFDGSYDADGRYTARLLTLKGRFIPQQDLRDKSAVVTEARRQLIKACDLVRSTTTLEVDESDETKFAYVRLADRVKIMTSKLNGITQFEIPLKAADPRKYGGNLASGYVNLPTASGGRTYPRKYPLVYASGSNGILSLTNGGDYSTPALITWYGAIDAPGVEHLESGSVLQFLLTLTDGETLQVDLDARTVLQDGSASRRYAMTQSSNWFFVLPGNNSFRLLGTQGAGTNKPYMTVAFNSAWM